MSHSEVNAFEFGPAEKDLNSAGLRNWITGTPVKMDGIMPVSDDFAGTPQLDFEGWRAFLRASCGNRAEVMDRSAFAGWVRPVSVCGLDAAALKVECGFAAVDSGKAYRAACSKRSE